MRDIAIQHGLPTFLVQLRHQAVHEAGRMTKETLDQALEFLQGFIYKSYWYPILIRLIKRNEQLTIVKKQIIFWGQDKKNY